MFRSLLEKVKYKIKLIKIKREIKKMVSKIDDVSKIKLISYKNCYGIFFKFNVDLEPKMFLECWFSGTCRIKIFDIKTTFEFNSISLFNFIYARYSKLKEKSEINEAFNSISELEKFFRNREI